MSIAILISLMPRLVTVGALGLPSTAFEDTSGDKETVRLLTSWLGSMAQLHDPSPPHVWMSSESLIHWYPLGLSTLDMLSLFELSQEAQQAVCFLFGWLELASYCGLNAKATQSR